MTAFLIRRIGQAAVVLAAMSVLVFVGIFQVGDPIEILAAADATQEERAAVAARLGLDRPMWDQYLIFLGNLAEGDLGTSFVYNRPTLTLILERLPATLDLAAAAMLLTAAVGIPLGLWAGLRPRSFAGRAIMAGSILGFSLPSFWVGLMLIMCFAVFLGWLPSTGRGATTPFLGMQLSLATVDGWSHLFLPALNLALPQMALVCRLVRAGVRETVHLDFIKFARAKGLPERRVVGVHLLKAIMIPVVTVLALELGAVIAFSVVTESIFAWPGMGKLIIDSIYQLDRPVVVGYLCVIVVMVVLINLAADVVTMLLDPRIRLQERGP